MIPKICINVFAGIEYPMLLPAVKDLGFEGIFIKEEISCDLKKLEQTKKTADELGLFIEALHSPIADCESLWTSGSRGDAYSDILKSNILSCEKLSIPILAVHIQPDFEKEPLFENGIKRLKEIAAYAKEHNTKIAFENINSAEYLYKTLDCLDASNVGFCYDSGHEYCYTRGEDFLKKAGDRLFCIHLHDNKGRTDKHQIPFDGKINFEHIISELHLCGYKGNLTFELCYTHRYRNLYSAEDFLFRSYEAACKIRKIYCK